MESGTHDELLAAGGAYDRLYAAQFRGPVLDGADPGTTPPVPVSPGA